VERARATEPSTAASPSQLDLQGQLRSAFSLSPFDPRSVPLCDRLLRTDKTPAGGRAAAHVDVRAVSPAA
jgi:hypothetical protein